MSGKAEQSHYVGLRDGIDYQQIPWRNGRFDPGSLEEKVENSVRMAKLWEAWQAHPGERTLVFCCSRRHALFARDWLKAHGVKAASVFSGIGGDGRGESLAALISGELEALCVVDLFNEGINLPAVDRVVMLRPTESKVIFLQQLGRGLRAMEGKTRLVVIDFVGNHRVFGQRIVHLLSLNSGKSVGLRGWLAGRPTTLPPGCLLDVELEAKAILRGLLPRAGSAVEETYQAMRDELGRRPSMSELFHRGYLPGTLRGQYGSWFGFVREKEDLVVDETAVVDRFATWLEMLEVTALNKSFKMVVLRVLLDWDALWEGMTVKALARACRTFLLTHPRLRADLKPNADIADHATTPEPVWASWWQAWPLERWLSPQNGRVWFELDGELFRLAVDCPAELRPAFESMTAELVDYRLARYGQSGAAMGQIGGIQEVNGYFEAKVSHAGGRPILFLPDRTTVSGIPVGPIDVTLPNGTVWEFRFVRIACNIAHPKGQNRGNQLGELTRRWFGPTAGLPGTGFQVEFALGPSGWSVKPKALGEAETLAESGQLASGPVEVTPVEESERTLDLVSAPPEEERFVRYVPVIDLEAAAGGWGPEHSPAELGWLRLEKQTCLAKGMFVARVRGHSMEPRIPSSAWCLFQPCPAGSREGRIVLVQFHSMSDPDNGGRYTVKKYHSTKRVTPEGWAHGRIQLLSLNPAFKPIDVLPSEAPQLRIVGEFVRIVE